MSQTRVLCAVVLCIATTLPNLAYRTDARADDGASRTTSIKSAEIVLFGAAAGQAADSGKTRMIENAKVNARKQQAELDRMILLLQENVVSKEEVENARMLVAEADLRLATVEKSPESISEAQKTIIAHHTERVTRHRRLLEDNVISEPEFQAAYLALLNARVELRMPKKSKSIEGWFGDLEAIIGTYGSRLHQLEGFRNVRVASSRDVEIARIDLARAKSRLELGRILAIRLRLLERMKQLYERNAATQADVDSAREELNEAQMQFEQLSSGSDN